MGAKESQNASFYAGDTRLLRFPLADPAGAPATLTSPVGYFKMAPELGALPVLSKTSPAGGCRVVQETINSVEWWVLYVDFDEADTKSIPGKYYYQIRVVSGYEKVVTASGVLTIKALIGA